MRTIPFLFLAALSLPAHAQLWEWADQRNEMVQFNHALPVGGGSWAVIGRIGFAGSHLISVRNGDGTTAWEQSDQYFTGQGYGDVVLLPDSGLLHVGASDGCDYLGPESRVRRYAADGAVLWERMITPQFTGLVTMAANGSIGLVAVASQDSVYVMDMDGNLVGGFLAQDSNIKKILWLGDSSLVIVMGTELHHVNIAGDELASATIGSTVIDMHWNGQDLFVLANYGVRLFSANLSPLGIAAFPDLDANSSFVVSGNGLWANTAAGLYQLAVDGTPSFLIPWPALPNLITTGCAVRDSSILSIGNTNISGRYTGVVRTLSISGDAPQHDQDVEVLLQVDSVWTEFEGGYYPWNRRADITGFVVNHGSDTLHSVVLSMWVQVPYLLCDNFVNRIDTTGFALASGDTLRLPFGVVDVELGLQTAQASGAGEICMVALAPDHLADRAPEDNATCASVAYALGVEASARNTDLSLAPNPVVNTCVLSGLGALAAPIRIAIMDPTGRIVVEHFDPAFTNNVQLDLSELPPATYIVRVEGVRNRAMMKLVIARP